MPSFPTTMRSATTDDADAIRDLVRAAYAKWVPVIGREPRPMQADYANAVREHDFDLLFAGDILVGLIETITHPDHLWIENIAIAPSHQGQGLGKSLLAHAERLAAAKNLPQLRLLTNEAFAANVALYSGAGYCIDRREPFMGGITVYMSRTL